MPRKPTPGGPVRIGPWLPTRKDAKRLGAKHYYSGIPCSNGHDAPRLASNNACMDCHNSKTGNYNKTKRATDPVWTAHKSELNKARWPERRERVRIAQKKWREENRETVREYNRTYQNAYRSRNPHLYERARVRIQEKRESDPSYVERERAKGRERYRENPEHYREKSRRRQRAEPETFATYARQRRGRIANAGGTHTKEDVEAINKRQKYKCAECGVSTRYKYDVDHIMPLALGGSNAASNLQILCPTCNRSKSALHPIDFANRRGRLL